MRNDAELLRRFNLDGSFNYSGMLEQQLQGEVDSWAVRWHLSVFMHDGMTLFPRKTLVENTGFDGSGTHCEPSDLAGVLRHEFRVNNFPAVAVDETARRAVYAYLARQGGLMHRLRRRLSKWLG
jgi:hypothetical protein